MRHPFVVSVGLQSENHFRTINVQWIEQWGLFSRCGISQNQELTCCQYSDQFDSRRLHLIFLAFKVSLDSRDKIVAFRYLRLMMNTVLSSTISASPICSKRSSRLTA